MIVADEEGIDPYLGVGKKARDVDSRAKSFSLAVKYDSSGLAISS
nr:hypothetical protein JVH1_0102 [Rhodococcus sp. JVH1]